MRYGRYKNIRYDVRYADEFCGQHKDSNLRDSPMDQAKIGRNFILWMMEEMGECIASYQEKGDSAIMRTEASVLVRRSVSSEMSREKRSDVLF
ncbi:MAG: hypothetical protein V8T36_07280 [Ruthenibacterium lactatiformans]